jgi:hypothetical protein
MENFIIIIDNVGGIHHVAINHIVEFIDYSDKEDINYKTIIKLSNGESILSKATIHFIKQSILDNKSPY